jgi:hypothetical protein
MMAYGKAVETVDKLLQESSGISRLIEDIEHRDELMRTALGLREEWHHIGLLGADSMLARHQHQHP